MEDVDALVRSAEEPARASARDVGELTQTMAGELRDLAVQARCTYLAYLLELAMIEASDLAAGRPPSGFAAKHGGVEPHPDIERIAERILAFEA